MQTTTADRAVTPVLGNVLLVAVVLLISIVILTLSFAFLEGTGTPTGEAAFEIEEASAGLYVVPEALGTDVDVELNGDRVAQINADSAGERVLIPTAPGDRMTIVSRDEDRSVLIAERIDDRSEIGDFIAYYRFDSGGPNTVKDRSGNGNDGELEGDPTWQTGGGGSLEFDGADDYVTIENISAPVTVDEFTVAVAYRQTGRGSDAIAQLVEHAWSGNEWFLETIANGSRGYSLDYAVGYPDNSGRVRTGDAFGFHERHVAVGTYDGGTFELYVDGELKADGTYSRAVDMGDMKFARDFESPIQYLNGELYEVRLYYTAFDGDRVRSISNAMD